METNQLLHTVLFWLKPDLSDEEVENFKGFFDELRKVPTIGELHVGQPAQTENRDVVDNTFTYSLFVTFDNQDDHDVYQDHEYHVNAVEKYSKYWDKVVVHDSVIQ